MCGLCLPSVMSAFAKQRSHETQMCLFVCLFYCISLDLRCAYLVGNTQEYVSLALELIGRCILLENTKRVGNNKHMFFISSPESQLFILLEIADLVTLIL